jgi:SsrA-binding protein
MPLFFVLWAGIISLFLAKIQSFVIIVPMAKKQAKKTSISTGTIARNKKAYFNFEIVEKIEAGISLKGSEVKSLRGREVDLEGSYAKLKGHEVFLVGCKIATYPQAGQFNHDPVRERKLLLHKAQINKIRGKLQQRGFTLVPLRVYFNARGIAKVEIGLAHGKRQFDKRDKLRQDQQKRDTARSMKYYKR